jgi:hypothetical protein
MKDDRNYPDLITREAEEEIEDLPFGPPSPVSDALRQFMRDIYAARAIEKAAAGRGGYYLLTAAGRRAAIKVDDMQRARLAETKGHHS